jgi:hypothetical protein
VAGTLYLATLHEPGTRHEIAFDAFAVGKGVHRGMPNITEAVAEYHAADGSLLKREVLDQRRTTTALDAGPDQRAMVMLRLRYDASLPFNVYGTVISAGGSAGVTYPVNAAIGFPEFRTWLNRVVMPLTAPPPGWRHELFIGNPSRWAAIPYRLRFHADGRSEQLDDQLPPKGHRLLPIEDTASDMGMRAPLEVIEAISRSKAVTYIVGRHGETGAISFVEHLVSQTRASLRLTRAAGYDRSPEDNAENAMESLFCFCNGMTLREALARGREGEVGNYCTGCRDDLRLVRQLLEKEPGLAKDAAALSSKLQACHG